MRNFRDTVGSRIDQSTVRILVSTAPVYGLLAVFLFKILRRVIRNYCFFLIPSSI